MFCRCRKIIFRVLICLVSMPLVCLAAGGKAPAVAADADAEKLLSRGFGAGRAGFGATGFGAEALLICLLQM